MAAQQEERTRQKVKAVKPASELTVAKASLADAVLIGVHL